MRASAVRVATQRFGEEFHVSWDDVARAYADDVARDQFGGGYAPPGAVASDVRRGLHHFRKSIERLLSLGLLQKADDGVDEGHDEDHECIDKFPEERRDHRREEQDVDQRLLELGEELDPQGCGFLGGKRVGTPLPLEFRNLF